MGLKPVYQKNSANSRKPPGSDGLKKKIKSFRGKSDKNQELNRDMLERLAQIGSPDLIVTHTPTSSQTVLEYLGRLG
ncbi:MULTISPECIES: hypothetical protein [Parachlamydia]|jgi:hypothetical protein|uniref:hypothetical protein n=1 Tax=Parachlamydia TaxID=83551 RepID=UPI0001C1733E|nr:hypothetical protein [Parachlamydia acanthamoebae]EFB40101.1 hypothetical protein pah_c265o002 [Parachlamydia acanthamoebae str. Hall's coccus]